MDRAVTQNGKFAGITGNTLKIIALIVMTIDHIGVQLYPNVIFLRIIGRLAFPIFGYMIAEGCAHTRKRSRYLLCLALTAVLCQTVYWFAMESLYQCIFVTFSLSVILIYLLDNAVKKGGLTSRITAVSFLALVAVMTFVLPGLEVMRGFDIDYGFFGILYPVLVYFAQGRTYKLTAAFAGLLLVAAYYSSIQWFSLLALPLIALYNGKRGNFRMKWFFYIYYPVHLAIIYGISAWLYS